MYTANHRFCIPTTLCGESFPVSTSNLAFTLSVRSRSRGVLFGFCYGGFSSTAGYVPGNEARLTLVPRRAREASDLHFQDDRSIKLSNRFYPFDSNRILRCDPSKPFGFGSGRSWPAAFRSFWPWMTLH